MAELTIPDSTRTLTHPILENDYASEWMGIEVLALRNGHATIRMTLRREMLNGFGIAHGGMIFALADSAFALACNPVTPGHHGHAGNSESSGPSDSSGSSGPHTITVAAGVDINFLKPAYPGQVITAVADLRAKAGRTGLYDIQIYAADAGTSPERGELIAEFRGRSRTITKK